MEKDRAGGWGRTLDGPRADRQLRKKSCLQKLRAAAAVELPIWNDIIMCKSSALGQHVGADTASSNDGGNDVSTLEKERQEKIESSAKFYWANDEEPHRRRSVICSVIHATTQNKTLYAALFIPILIPLLITYPHHH